MVPAVQDTKGLCLRNEGKGIESLFIQEYASFFMAYFFYSFISFLLVHNHYMLVHNMNS